MAWKVLRGPQVTRQRAVASPSPLNGESAGVRGEQLKKRPMPLVDLPHHRPHLTLPSPLPPGAERECFGSSVVRPVTQTISGRDAPSPSPLNGERAGVRGEKLRKRPMPLVDLPHDRPHLTLPPSGEGRPQPACRLSHSLLSNAQRAMAEWRGAEGMSWSLTAAGFRGSLSRPHRRRRSLTPVPRVAGPQRFRRARRHTGPS